MNSHITDKFRKAFAELPADVRKQAPQAYRLLIENPQPPKFTLQIHSSNALHLFSPHWIKLSSSGDTRWRRHHLVLDRLSHRLRQINSNVQKIIFPRVDAAHGHGCRNSEYAQSRDGCQIERG